MANLGKQMTVWAVTVGLVTLTLPRPSAGAGSVAPGAPTASGAAVAQFLEPVSGIRSANLRDGWRRAFAYSDTTGYEFPEDEVERTTKDLVKDVVLWTVVAGFMAFFIIKVFIEGDDPDPPDDPNSKPPPGFTISPVPAASPSP